MEMRPNTQVGRQAARAARNSAVRIAVTALCMLATPVRSAEVRVTVVDGSGASVGGAVVTLQAAPSTPQPRRHSPTPPASVVMDQVGQRFTPSILVVPVGTAVSFPNSDLVSHQVYSFSPAKKFQLPLYRGKAYPPVVFDAPGVVTLGCNIHDDMVAHIVVTDAPYYALTDDAGRAGISGVEPGDYVATVWHPRLRPGADALRQPVVLDSPTASLTVQFRSDAPLRAERSPARRPGWDDY
jgi:plastocyanin